jgi:quercetin dioxygenase-like cupin family protein
MKLLFAAATSVALTLSPAIAQQAQQNDADQALPSGFNTEPVLKSGETADGDPLQFPQGENVEIVSVVGTLDPGGRTARHQHPVPVYVYVLEGELEVQTEGGEPRTYKKGEAFLESVNHWHQAFNEGNSPTKILVVFMGAQGQPTTVTK